MGSHKRNAKNKGFHITVVKTKYTIKRILKFRGTTSHDVDARQDIRSLCDSTRRA